MDLFSKRNLLLLAFTARIITPVYAEHTSITPPGYAVASAHPLATNAGLDVLAQGGNAFDAAIAIAATLAVVEPYHSGLGGGSFWLLHEAQGNKNIFVDAREVAPQAASKDMYLDAQGKVIPGLSLNGGLAAAIPGHPAALAYIAQHYGRLPLTKTLAPAIKYAQNGFLVDTQFRYFSTMPDRLKYLRKYPATAAIFLDKGQPYALGQCLIQTDLANTLRVLAVKGHDGFYQGRIAEQLVKGVNAAGGIWSLNDLSHYKVKLREPLIGAYHNMLIITAPPPSAGGVALLTMLNVLSYYPLSSLPKVDWVHTLVEAMRLAYWQRDQYLGDPDFIKTPVEQLISADNAKYLKRLIQPNKPIDSKQLHGVIPQEDTVNTSHFSVIDAEGNRVAATMTINFIFGSSVVAAGTGVLLNDEMDDFSTKLGTENVFGLVGSSKNEIAPGKRPLSSMAPTFLELPDRVAILGTPGGSRIPTMVLLASLVFKDGGGAISMVSAMRFHHQFLPDLVQFEPDTLTSTVQDALIGMGYHLKALQQHYGDMQAISWNKREKQLTAASDPRGIGLAATVEQQTKGYGVNY